MIYTHELNPILLQLGPLQLRWYGLMYVVGFMGTYFLLRKFSKEGSFKLSFIQIEYLLFYAFVGLFVGARFFYVFVYNFSYYIHNLIEIIAIWKGLAGLSFHGGMIGVVIAAILFSRKHKIPFWDLEDLEILLMESFLDDLHLELGVSFSQKEAHCPGIPLNSTNLFLKGSFFL